MCAKLRCAAIKLNTIDTGNPLPRELDPGLLWPGSWREGMFVHSNVLSAQRLLNFEIFDEEIRKRLSSSQLF